jgi:hypothetical protein
MDGSLDKETIEYLLSIGAIEFAFTDEDGKNIYRMLPSAKTIVPNLYEQYVKSFNSTVFSLWTRDGIDVVFDESGEPMVGINENSIDNNFIAQLSNKEKDVLKEIVSLISRVQDDNDTIGS